MRAQYFNMVIQATDLILREQARIELKKDILKGDISQKTSQEVNVTIGLFGEIQGWVTFGMSHKTAKFIASAVVETVLHDEKIIGNTIIAFGRAITDKASTHLREDGVRCYSTDATLIMGTGNQFFYPVQQKLTACFRTVYGPLEIRAFMVEAPSRTFTRRLLSLPEDTALNEVLFV